MLPHPLPPSKCRRFERITIVGEQAPFHRLKGHLGVVYWSDFDTHPHKVGDPLRWAWNYVVHLPALNRYCSLPETELHSAGDFEAEASFLGVEPEISFDLVVGDDNPFMEGTYRLPGKLWEVVIFAKENVTTLKANTNAKWKNDVTGACITGARFEVPKTVVLNRDYILRTMSSAFGIENWREVRGPDSIVLR